ncbi:DEAD/DEAH box helicase, partial [Ralstonia pseudosolanacearum]|uniref:DEAD/DEAH box helicase n=1 Tax=Ralstonia pseudosolanacearum TaxID=1310165 RepID=UPI003CE755C3
ICQGNDTLGLMPTGGGKSITFQVPALAMDGVCIVFTPLIALMKDQVAHLRKNGIRAAAINSSMTHGEVVNTLENAILGNTKLLYISPERLNSELFQRKLSHVNVSFVTVDEAHCISQWGYDFRPSYLHIARIRTIIAANKKNAGRVPILALTATATPRVVSDIQQRL